MFLALRRGIERRISIAIGGNVSVKVLRFFTRVPAIVMTPKSRSTSDNFRFPISHLRQPAKIKSLTIWP